MFETIGYDGQKPLAVIEWSEKGHNEPSYKTFCYDEEEVIKMYQIYNTKGSFYATLIPTITKVV